MKTTTLYRPVGKTELALIANNSFKTFPPRLAWQPIFYPVLNEQYASQIAEEWNSHDSFSGYEGHVLSFEVSMDYLRKYPVQNVGGNLHDELWIPAEELEALNQQIIGTIKILKSYHNPALQ